MRFFHYIVFLSELTFSFSGFFLSQAVVAFNATSAIFPRDDPKSFTEADVIISLLQTETPPHFAVAQFTAEIAENSPSATPVPGISILVVSFCVAFQVK